MKKRIFCMVLTLLCLLSPMMFTKVSANSSPTVFIGDEVWYKYDRYRIFEQDEITYIPSALFSYIDGYSVEYVEKQSAMLINGGESFVSFDFVANCAWDMHGNRTDIKCYCVGQEWYLPGEYVCEKLGIGFEKYLDGEDASVRVFSGEIEFDELRRMYTSDNTVAAADPDLDIHGKHKLRRVYLCFYLTIDERTDELLEMLADNGITATFFVSNDDTSGHYEYLLKIASYGHSIGIDMSKTVQSEFDGTSNDIFTATKKTCRLLGRGRLSDKRQIEGYTLQSPGHDLASEASELNSNMLNQYLRTLYYDTANVFSFYTYDDAERYISSIIENKPDNAAFLPMSAVAVLG
jgi:hypothetical protein